MNIKRLGLAALAAIGMASVPTKASAQFDRSTIETVAAMLLAEKLGIDPMIVSGLLGGDGMLGGGSLYEMAPALALQRQAPNQNIDSILGLRNQGLGWNVIANRIGVQPSRYQQLRSSGQLDNNYLWRDTITDELHLSNDTVSRLRNMGLDWRDIVMTTLVSRESGTPLSTVANRYRSDRNWSRVAGRYGVTRNRVTNRISSWRSRRSFPANWARNSTGWAPPGLAKKGGLPPGIAKRTRSSSGTWNVNRRRRDNDIRSWDSGNRRTMVIRSKAKVRSKGNSAKRWNSGSVRSKGNSGKHFGGGNGRGKGNASKHLTGGNGKGRGHGGGKGNGGGGGRGKGKG